MSADPSVTTIEALLAERGWMRSLATALLKDADVADELVQDALVLAVRRPPGSDRPLRPWLRTVLRNLAWKRLQGDADRRAIEAERASRVGEASVPSAEELSAKLELQHLLVGFVRELDEPFRSTVLLRFHEDLRRSRSPPAPGRQREPCAGA